VIDALLAFEGEVDRQVAELAARAGAAEQELQLRSEAESAADLFLEEARKRASEITKQASQHAQELLKRAQHDIDALQLGSQRELIAAFRQYLQQIEIAQSTLLRIGRRALSALVAEVEEDPQPFSETQDSAETPVIETTSSGAISGGTRKVQPKRRLLGKSRSVSEPSEAEFHSATARTSEEDGAHPSIAVDHPAASENNPNVTSKSTSTRPSQRQSNAGDERTEVGHDSPRVGGSDQDGANQTEAALTTLVDSPHNLIDLRNRRDLDRLDEPSGPIMRAISRRRANGSIQDL
jgi:hypothetical protein